MPNPHIVEEVQRKTVKPKRRGGGGHPMEPPPEGSSERNASAEQEEEAMFKADMKEPDRVCPKMGRTGCCLVGALTGSVVGLVAGAYVGVVMTKAAVQAQLTNLLGSKLAAAFTL